MDKEPNKQTETTENLENETKELEQEAEELEETETAENSTEAPKQTTETQPQTSSKESSSAENFRIVSDRVDQLAKLLDTTVTTCKEACEKMEACCEEMKTTLELNQEQIGSVNDAAEAVTTAAAALVKLHKAQNSKN